MTRSLAIASALLLLALPTPTRAQGRAGSQTEEDQAFDAAEEAFKANRDEEAARLYDRVIAINPSRPDPWVKRGVILYKQRKFSDAVNLLRRAQQTLPNDNAVKGQLGLSLYRAGAPDLAVSMLEEVAAAQPDRFQIQLQLGQHYVKSGDGKRAVPALEAYFKHRPVEAASSDLQIRPLLGTAYLLARQYGDAEREFESVLKTNPKDVTAREHLGEVFTARGDCSKAITLYERLLGEAPKQPSIYYNLGTCYLRVNRWPDAQRCAEQYGALRPKEPKGFLLLGDARFENRDAPGALIAYEQAARLDPGHPPAARLARVLLAQKSYPQAIKVLEEAERARPDDLEIQAQLVEAYVATRGAKEKLVATGERLGRGTDEGALTAAGVAFYAAGEDGRAERLFTQAIELDPRSRRARSGLLMALNRAAASSLATANGLPAAEGALLRAQKLDPESLQTNRNLGVVLLLERRFPEAERALRKALAKVPRDVVLNRLVGRAVMAQKRRDEAIKLYETAQATALRTRGAQLAEVQIELGPLYLEANKIDLAVAALESATREAPPGPVANAAARNLAIALYRRGVERMKDGKLADAAVDDLGRAAQAPKGALLPRELGAVDCAAGLASLRAGKSAAAQEALGRASREGGCTLKPPYEKIGVEFFAAYAQYRDTQNPLKREAAAKIFQRLLPKAGGALASSLRDLVRSSYELEGYDFYVRGEQSRAAGALRSASQLAARSSREARRELDHNLAVIDLAEGRAAPAQRTFEDLGQRPPEALVNLGILLDRQGESKRALDLYKRALERGVRAPRLREWIDVKERLLGGRQVIRVVALALLALSPLARADGKLTVGLFAPNGAFESAEARYSFAARLAQVLAKETGQAVEPKAFARGADFEAAIKKNQIDLAIVDAVYLAERGVPWTVVAIAAGGGQTSAPWALFSADAATVLDLKSKRLAFATTGGRDAEFVDNALLEGEFQRHFGARQGTPDVASAVAAVSLRKADCVFAPDTTARGLRKVYDAGRVPNPALVLLRPLAPELLERVRKAVLASSGGGAYDGWRAGAGDPYRALGAKLAAKTRRPVMTEPQAVPIDESEALAPSPLEPALLDVKDQFWTPQGTP